MGQEPKCCHTPFDVLSDLIKTPSFILQHGVSNNSVQGVALILNSHQELIEWYRSTAMKPYLDSLRNDSERAEFEKEVLGECKAYYPLQSDGRILYPFKRLFFTARNSGNGKR